jgi:hypothetical protein
MYTLGKSFILILIIGTLLVACTSQPAGIPIPTTPATGNPYAPQPADGSMTRGDAEIVSTSLLVSESQPPEVSISLAYRLPTPCYQLRVIIGLPDGQNRIHVEVYGLTPKNKACNLMALLTPLETNLSLGIYPAGHYSVIVNGQLVGVFDAR